MMKLKSKRLYRTFSKLRNGNSGAGDVNYEDGNNRGMSEVKWELRPGGMLVQRREVGGGSVTEGVIIVRVTTVSQWHYISIQATSTFGELKGMLSSMTSLEAKEQRLLFKGKEREDGEHLHMVGVRHNDKILLLQDPAIQEKKLLGLNKTPLHRTIIV
ncbi:hypothetical protein L1887_36847 [Cichorium endivia]|nr:hypothetical protein L1887_36847 [Cichorium endivia]